MRRHSKASIAGSAQCQIAHLSRIVGNRISHFASFALAFSLLAAVGVPASASAAGPPTQAFTAFAAPRTDTTAVLNGRVNPEGEAITYRFEYSEDGGANWIDRPDRENTSLATEQIVVADELTGLSPGTVYQYRFLVEDPAGPASPQGAVRDFRTRTSEEVAAPGRGIELVNRPTKGNQNVRTQTAQGVSPISADGERAVWSVLGGAPGGHTGAGATFLAERTAAGWVSKPLVPEGEQQAGKGEGGGYILDTTTPELTSFVFNTGATALERGKTLARVNANQHQTVLQEYQSEVFGQAVGMTADGSQVFFVSPGNLQLEAMTGEQTEVVSIMPDGLPNECGLNVTEGLSFMGSAGSFEAAAELWRSGYQRIATNDGMRAYFQAYPNGVACGSTTYGLYERNRETGQTVLIDPGASGRAPEAIRATPDGREFYFVTWSNLDPSDTNTSRDIYRWREQDGESHCLTCIVPNPQLASYQGSATRSVLVSNDFSHVYFESTGELVPGHGKAGDANVYSLSGGILRFVADPNYNGGQGILQGATLSHSGDVLLFLANEVGHRELTADKLAEPCLPTRSQQSPEPCDELFRYDDSDEGLECISCRHSGITENSVNKYPGLLGGSAFQLSPDGRTAAFTTAERLVPEDVNRSIDIYEWRNGETRLISDGVTTYPGGLAEPEVVAVGDDGRDIFFTLVDPGLTGFEQDGFSELYDARIGGGFEPPPPAAHCAQESCQDPPKSPPALQTTSSAAFVGAGNAKPHRAKRCGKGKTRRGGRCVRKAHRRRAHRHHRHTGTHHKRRHRTHTVRGVQ